MRVPDGKASTVVSRRSHVGQRDTRRRGLWTSVGIASACAAFLSLALLSALGKPWIGTGDAPFHLDYVYQVAQGHLPQPYGLEFFPGAERYAHGRQYASAHPPLFYALAAWFAGGTLSLDSWTQAVLRIRLLNVVIGTLTVLACTWVAWESTRVKRSSFVVAVGATAPLVTSFVLMSGDIYNDVLLALMSTLAIGMVLRCLHHGASWPRVLVLGLLSAIGMLVKATFIVVLAVSVGGIVIVAIVRRVTDGRTHRSLLAATLCKIVLVIAIPVTASAWFYARNIGLSGAWNRSTPKAPLHGREEKSLTDVLTSPQFYKAFFGQLFGSTPTSVSGVDTSLVSLALSMTALLALLVWSVRNARAWTQGATVDWVFTRLAPVGVFLGVYVAQMSHAVGYGQYNIRYFFPAIVVVGLLLGGGATACGRWSGLVTFGMMGVFGLSAVNYMGWLVTGRAADMSLLDRTRSIGGQLEVNGFSPQLLKVFVLAFIVSSVMAGLATSLLATEEHAVSELRQASTDRKTVPSDAAVAASDEA